MRTLTFERAADAAAALAAFQPDSQYVAGGTTLVDLMKLDVMRPEVVIDINGLAREHAGVTFDASGLRLGALARMAEVAVHPVVARDYPVIAQSLLLAASPQLRNMATLGGNVLQRTRCDYFRDPAWAACNKRNPGSGCAALDGINRKHAVLGTSAACIATYPGDFAQALIALDASVELLGAGGGRTIPFADLHREPGSRPEIETHLAAGELISAFLVPPIPWAKRSLYLKIRDRQSYEFALASAAVALDLAGEEVRQVRIGLGGVATRPWRAREAEAALTGKPATNDNFATAAKIAFAAAHGRQGNRFKIELGQRTLVRALAQAAQMRV
jgi:xanthine dehydrogenase YagS FAD-binding subunit